MDQMAELELRIVLYTHGHEEMILHYRKSVIYNIK